MATMFGWLSTGLVRRRWPDMRSALFSSLRTRWRPDVDLSDDALIALMMQIQALEQVALWQLAESIYYSRYRGTADATALDLRGGELLLSRRAESYATGALKLTSTEGALVSVGDTVRCGDGTQFVVTLERIVPASGIIDVPIRAVNAGPVGNKGVGCDWLHARGVGTLSGDADADEFETFDVLDIDTWKEVAPGERFDTYEEIEVADISYPTNLDTIAVAVRNPTSEDQLYYLYLVIEDAETGAEIGQTQIRAVQLQPDVQTVVSFSGQEFDVSGSTTLRVVVVLGEGTTQALEIGCNGTAPYGGTFRLLGVAQASVDAWVNLTSIVTGMTSGGASVEGDYDYRCRQLMAIGRAANGTVDSLTGNLIALDGVRHVRVDYNPTLVVDGYGVDPKAVRVTIAGGSVREIGRTILACKGSGIASCGSDTIAVDNPNGGPAIPISFERPSEVVVYVGARVTMDRPSVLTDSARTAIIDAIIAYIGGVSSDGTVHRGLAPGDNVSIARVHAAICSVRGVKTAVVRLSKTGLPMGDEAGQNDDMAISASTPVEVAMTRTDAIEVV